IPEQVASIARVLANQEQIPQALELFRRVFVLAPGVGYYHFEAALLYSRIDDHEQALKEARTYLESFGGNLKRITPQQITMVLPIFEKAGAMDEITGIFNDDTSGEPNPVGALVEARRLKANGDFDGAFEAYTRLYEKSNDSAMLTDMIELA